MLLTDIRINSKDNPDSFSAMQQQVQSLAQRTGFGYEEYKRMGH